MLAFYDFPAEHWKHLRTTNVIESSFATVRHRTVRSKGCLSNKTALAMIFKLAEAAEKNWRRLDGHNQLPKVILGVKFTDGMEIVKSQAQAVAADPFRHQNLAIAPIHRPGMNDHLMCVRRDQAEITAPRRPPRQVSDGGESDRGDWRSPRQRPRAAAAWRVRFRPPPASGRRAPRSVAIPEFPGNAPFVRAPHIAWLSLNIPVLLTLRFSLIWQG